MFGKICSSNTVNFWACSCLKGSLVGLINEGAYIRNRKSASKQVIGVLFSLPEGGLLLDEFFIAGRWTHNCGKGYRWVFLPDIQILIEDSN